MENRISDLRPSNINPKRKLEKAPWPASLKKSSGCTEKHLIPNLKVESDKAQCSVMTSSGSPLDAYQVLEIFTDVAKDVSSPVYQNGLRDTGSALERLKFKVSTSAFASRGQPCRSRRRLSLGSERRGSAAGFYDSWIKPCWDCKSSSPDLNGYNQTRSSYANFLNWLAMHFHPLSKLRSWCIRSSMQLNGYYNPERHFIFWQLLWFSKRRMMSDVRLHEAESWWSVSDIAENRCDECQVRISGDCSLTLQCKICEEFSIFPQAYSYSNPFQLSLFCFEEVAESLKSGTAPSTLSLLYLSPKIVLMGTMLRQITYQTPLA